VPSVPSDQSSNMKTNKPSRTARMVARQRAAHQVLDCESILHDPFAVKILGEDERDVLQFATKHRLASIGRLYILVGERELRAGIETGVIEEFSGGWVPFRIAVTRISIAMPVSGGR